MLQTMALTIRKMNYRDYAQVGVIDRASFPDSWKRHQWIEARKILSCFVIVRKDIILGYLCCNSEEEIIRMAVDPINRRMGVGTELIAFKGRSVQVEESNLVAQLFFRSVGFKWVKTIGSYYKMERVSYAG